MKVYLDDERETPEGWMRCYWPDEVNKLLLTGQVTEVSLDHDLGDDVRGTGYDVIKFIEERVVDHGFIPPVIHIHTANPAARHKMDLGLWSINRYIHQQGKKHPAFEVVEARHATANQERASARVSPVSFRRNPEEFDGVQWDGSDVHLTQILIWLDPKFTISQNTMGSPEDESCMLIVPHLLRIRKGDWIGKINGQQITVKEQATLDINYTR